MTERAGDKPLHSDHCAVSDAFFADDYRCTCGLRERVYAAVAIGRTASDEPPAEPKPGRMDTCGGVADTCEGCSDCMPAQPHPAPEPPDRLRDVAREYSAALHIVGCDHGLDWGRDCQECVTDFLHAALVRVVASERERAERYKLMLQMAAEDEGGGVSFFLFWRDDEPQIDVNCGDTFGYACADSETIPPEQLAEVWRRYKADRLYGPILWAQERRGGMPFIKELAERIRARGLEEKP